MNELVLPCFTEQTPRLGFQKAKLVQDDSATTVSVEMLGVNPSGSSGAQWSFNGTMYCAYNNGNDGISSYVGVYGVKGS